MMDMRAVSFRHPERIKKSLGEHLKVIQVFKQDAILPENLTCAFPPTRS
jgi:hypothetical protein